MTAFPAELAHKLNKALHDHNNALNDDYQQKQQIADTVYSVVNQNCHDLPCLFDYSGCVDGGGILKNWCKSAYVNNRGYSEHTTYVLLPIMEIGRVSAVEAKRMLAINPHLHATLTELLSFMGTNRESLRKFLKVGYRIINFGIDRFNVGGFKFFSVRLLKGQFVVEEHKQEYHKLVHPKDLALVRMP
jgi:hypothetical protein